MERILNSRIIIRIKILNSLYLFNFPDKRKDIIKNTITMLKQYNINKSNSIFASIAGMHPIFIYISVIEKSQPY